MLLTGMGGRGASIARQHVILSTGMRRLGNAYCEMSTGSSSSILTGFAWLFIQSLERHDEAFFYVPYSGGD